MSSKYCPICDEIVTTSTVPNYCCWCGFDLRNKEILPEFKTYEERLKVKAEARNNIKPGQLSLF